MRVDRIRYKYILELIENHLKTTSEEESPFKKEAHLKSNGKIPDISAEVLRLLSSLTDSERKTLISTWLKLNLPFDPKPLHELITLIKTAPDMEESLSRIKAFALIYKNKLPLLSSLIIGLSRCFNPRSSLINHLNQLMESENSPKQISPTPVGEQNGSIKNFLSRLFIDMSLSPEKLTAELKEYPIKLGEILEYLNNNPEKAKPELHNHLLGQQLLNNQGKNLLLALEFPLFSPEYNKLYPGHLQVWRDSGNNKNNTLNQDNLKIKFLISLEKRGLIRADAYYKKVQNQPASIKIGFKCSSSKTKELVKENIALLQKALEKQGLIVGQITIELNEQSGKSETEGELRKFFEELPGAEENKNLPQIKHINFRI